MIVRIMGEGQFELDDSHLDALKQLDDAVEQAVESGDADGLAAALASLMDEVRSAGVPVQDDALVDSDLILPNPEADLEQIRSWLDETGSDEGLIPN